MAWDGNERYGEIDRFGGPCVGQCSLSLPKLFRAIVNNFDADMVFLRGVQVSSIAKKAHMGVPSG